MTTLTDAVADDRALKAKHRAMWASGDYPALARELISELGPTLVDACQVTPGSLVLDVAAGSGNAAIPAAQRGASVVASDLTPELFDAGRLEADRRGVDIDWRVADAEALPFPDAAFDTVMSSVGVMFAPRHQVTADELVRVCRPGGTIGLISWTPEGFIGQLFATMKPFSPPPPAGASPPPLWGDETHVTGLLGDRVEHVTVRRQSVRIDQFPGRTDFRAYFTSHYGPTMAIYRHIADDAEQVAALDRAIDDLAARFTGDRGMEWEYLMTTCVRS
jgi:SAM-dependent methyltransferase